MNTETANLLFQLLYVLRQDHTVAAKITAVRCGGTLLLIPDPSMIGSADAGVTSLVSHIGEGEVHCKGAMNGL